MNSKNNVYVPGPRLLDADPNDVTHIPNSWFKKLSPMWGRRSLWPIAVVILDLSRKNGGMGIVLPKSRQPLGNSSRFSVPYDGLGSRSIWRQALLELERRHTISITWRKNSALVIPILTGEEQRAQQEDLRPASPLDMSARCR